MSRGNAEPGKSGPERRRRRGKPSVVKHGRLLDVIGRPRWSAGLMIVGALVDLDEPVRPVIEFRLDDQIDGPEALGMSFDDAMFLSWWDVMWVRARIPRVFHFAPPPAANNTPFLINAGFLAVGRFGGGGALTAFPFACAQGYDPGDDPDETPPYLGLNFSAWGPGRAERVRIARAFWSLLLERPSDLEPFVDHVGWIESCSYHVGYERGQFYSLDYGLGLYPEDDAVGEEIPLLGFVTGDKRACDDCEGTGVDLVFPYKEDCPTCRGSGMVTW